MIIAILTTLSAFFSLAKIIIEKFVPDKVHKEIEFKAKRRMITGLEQFRGKTLEQIAQLGKRQRGEIE